MATLIPREFVKDAAVAHNVKWRTFDPWSHLLTLVVVQLSRQESRKCPEMRCGRGLTPLVEQEEGGEGLTPLVE